MLESKKHYTHKDHKPHNKNYTKIITENHKSEKPTFLKLKQNKRDHALSLLQNQRNSLNTL